MYSRKIPTIYNIFKIIKEDVKVETPWKKYNGFKVVEDKEEATKVPAKKDVPLKKDL